MTLSSTSSAYAAGLAGISAGSQRVAAAGKALVSELEPEHIVDMKLGELQTKASAKVVKAIDEALGSLIDEMA